MFAVSLYLLYYYPPHLVLSLILNSLYIRIGCTGIDLLPGPHGHIYIIDNCPEYLSTQPIMVCLLHMETNAAPVAM